jgi:Tetratricopeptide repeat
LLGVLHDEGLWAMQTGDSVRARACLEESLAGVRELGAKDDICNCLLDLGVVALYERQLEEAVHLFAESLELARQTGWHMNIAWNLGGLGCALATLGELGVSARLLGAAEALHERLGRPLEPWAARVYTDCSAPVRERLGEAELAAAWAAGRALSEADAAAYALRTVAD